MNLLACAISYVQAALLPVAAALLLDLRGTGPAAAGSADGYRKTERAQAHE